MALPASTVFHQLDAALAAAVAAISPSVVHVSRGRGGGTGIVWAPDLVVTSSFHTPDRTTVGVGRADGTLDAVLRVDDVTETSITLSYVGPFLVMNDELDPEDLPIDVELHITARRD